MKKKKLLTTIVTLTLIAFLNINTHIKAEQTNVNVNSYSYNIYYWNVDDNTGNVTEQNTGWFTGDKNSFRSGTNTFEKYYVQMNTETLSYNQVYTINFSLWITTRGEESFYKSMKYMILGSSNGQYSGATSENIQSYTCIATIPPDTTSRINVSCNIVPKYNVNYLYIRADDETGGNGEELTSIGNNKPTITYNNSQQATENAINNQTTIIQNGNEQTQTIINNGFNDLNENINNQFNTKCSNLLNIKREWHGNSYTISKNNINITASNWAFYTNINVEKNTVYYFNFKSNNVSVLIQNSDGSVNISNWENTSFNFNTGNNTDIRILFNLSNVLNENVNISNIMLSKETSSFCEYGTSTNKLDETNKILNEDKEYNHNASENIEGKQDLDNYGNEEKNLLEGLEFEVEEAEVSINPQASEFIWRIIEIIRGTSGKIVLLFTSILALGLIKMVLNR